MYKRCAPFFFQIHKYLLELTSLTFGNSLRSLVILEPALFHTHMHLLGLSGYIPERDILQNMDLRAGLKFRKFTPIYTERQPQYCDITVMLL